MDNYYKNKKNIKYAFQRIKLIKCNQINKVYEQSMSTFNKLSKELIELSHFNDDTYKEKYLQEISKNIKESSNIIKKKKKIIKLKSCKNMLLDNKTKITKFDMKISENNKALNKNNSLCILSDNSFIDTPKNKNNSLNSRIVSNYFKRKINNIKFLKGKKINLKKAKIVPQYTPSSNRIDNSIIKNKNNLSDNIYEKDFKFHTIITFRKEENQSLNNKNKIIKLKKKNHNNAKSSIKFYKKLLSNQELSKIKYSSMRNIKNISTIENNKSIMTARQNFYNIKNLLKKFDISSNDEKPLKYNLRKDFNIKKINERIKNFKNSTKGFISYHQNMNKTLMASKKNADIINYGDICYIMEDEHFFKNRKIYMQKYRILSKIALMDNFEKNNRDVKSQSPKNISKRNTENIRSLLKLYKKSLKKFNCFREI